MPPGGNNEKKDAEEDRRKKEGMERRTQREHRHTRGSMTDKCRGRREKEERNVEKKRRRERVETWNHQRRGEERNGTNGF